VLAKRTAELMAPIRMADALSRNFVGDVDSIDANCLVHCRRQFVNVVKSFPDQVEVVLDKLALVYEHDAEAKNGSMTAEERLAYHQTHSEPIMNDLRAWMKRQMNQRLVEPNSGLGGALAYLDDHWERLTRFLRVAGAPLDSNIVERVLKKAIRHRRNSLFYRSIRGAEVGDCFMSLIHTAEAHGVNAFDYLTSLLKYAHLVADAPADWLPWNYGSTMERFGLS
jgi:transposase